MFNLRKEKKEKNLIFSFIDCLNSFTIEMIISIGLVLVISVISFICLYQGNKINAEYKCIATQYCHLIDSKDFSENNLKKVQEDIKTKYNRNVHIVDDNCIDNIKSTDTKDKFIKVRVSNYVYITAYSNSYFIEDTGYNENRNFMPPPVIIG